MYLFIIDEATTFIKLALTLDAKALAKSVFPVPGGPYNNTPLGAEIPTRLNSSGFVIGSSIDSLSIFNYSPNPPISSNDTFPGSSVSIL